MRNELPFTREAQSGTLTKHNKRLDHDRGIYTPAEERF
jgi:hypothetical protein